MNKVLYIPEEANWDKVTTLLFKAGIKYSPFRDENVAGTEVNTLAFNREFMWLASHAKNPNAVTIGQNEIEQIALLEHSPQAVVEWLFSL